VLLREGGRRRGGGGGETLVGEAEVSFPKLGVRKIGELVHAELEGVALVLVVRQDQTEVLLEHSRPVGPLSIVRIDLLMYFDEFIELAVIVLIGEGRTRSDG